MKLLPVLLLSAFCVTAHAQKVATTDNKTFIEESVPKAEWSNAGFNKPSDTMMTFMWAMKEGNMSVLLECYDPQIITQPAYSSESFKEELKEGAVAATSLQIVAVDEIDSNKVAVKFLVGGWHDKPLVHKFVLINGQWKIAGECTMEAAD